MIMLNMVFKTGQMFKILLLCFLTFKAVEGVQITTNVSTKVDAAVHLIHTADIMNYTTDVNKYNLDLSGITSLVFKIKSCSDAHVLLSSSGVRNSSEPLYEIYIGYHNNESYITYCEDNPPAYGSNNSIVFSTENILNCTVYLPFWVSWSDKDIKLGTGKFVGDNVLGNLTITHNFEVKSIGVFTDHLRLGNWIIQLEVSDKFAGYFDSCIMNNTKSDMVVVDDINCSKMSCGASCGMSKTCMGYNFNSAINRCELLWFVSDVVTDIPHHTEAGWRFYSKCFNRKSACLGCYF
ncbi:uncharacterized protein LOC134684003 [Mytilus trossulus]|uniref:uncharacterized protein LOC134684003 n=1 Tax=Mytilus trossulus TaxID=6551 RepID=UPI003005C20E